MKKFCFSKKKFHEDYYNLGIYGFVTFKKFLFIYIVKEWGEKNDSEKQR